MKSIGILGAGSWACALANLLVQNKHNVTMWEIDEKRAKQLDSTRKLEFLPEIQLQRNIEITSNLEKVLCRKDIVLIAIPSHFVRSTFESIQKIKPSNLEKIIFVSAVKGIEVSSLKRISEIISEIIPEISNNICALSGPSFAVEVANKIPTAIVAAGKNAEITKIVQKTFSTEYCRIYTNTDIIGVELGGALKNIFAIACGISDGIGCGDNTKAAIVTRGLRELVKLGIKMGGELQTFYGLSGLGDLMLTCFSKHSRNRLLGEKVGLGILPDDAIKEISMVAEGYLTTKSAYNLINQYRIDSPVINETYLVLYKRKSVNEAINNLMLRELKSESYGLKF